MKEFIWESGGREKSIESGQVSSRTDIEITPEIRDAQKKAMSILQRMDRTEWELRDKLAQKDYSPEAIQVAVDYVRSFHYIDDMRFARHFVEIHREQRSIQRMKQDMYKKHVPEEYIELALEEIDRDDTLALHRAAMKLTKGNQDFTYEEKEKMAAKLYRRGFRLQDIKKELSM